MVVLTFTAHAGRRSLIHDRDANCSFDGDTAGVAATLLRSARLQARSVGAAYRNMAAFGATGTLIPQVRDGVRIQEDLAYLLAINTR